MKTISFKVYDTYVGLCIEIIVVEKDSPVFNRTIYRYLESSYNIDLIKHNFMLSQEEIDALTEELSEYHEKFNKKDSQLDFNLINNKTQCAHIWRDYQGLNESFKYCTVCDEKMKG